MGRISTRVKCPLCGWQVSQLRFSRDYPLLEMASFSQRAMVRVRRSLAASQAASQRKLNQRLADLERASRERREALDRELGEKRWDLLMGKK